MDTTKTMREICADEPLFESFLVLKGFPFSLQNPIVDLVTFEDVVVVQGLDKESFLAEFERYKSGSVDAESINKAKVHPQVADPLSPRYSDCSDEKKTERK